MRGLRVAATALAAAAALVLSGTGTASATGSHGAYSVSTVTAGDQTMVARWNPCQPAITAMVNVAGAGRTSRARASAEADARRALSELATATGLPISYLGTTDYVPTGTDWARTAPAEIVVAWIDDRGGRTSDLLQRSSNGMAVGATGGYSFTRWSYGETWTGVIARGFVVVNARARQVRPGYGAGITRGNLLLHELGHVVGLEHTDDTDQLMNPVLLPRQRSGYADGDLAGLSQVGTTAGCVDVPAGIVTDL